MSGTAGVVAFSYATWAGMFPELSSYIAEPAAQGYFNRACLICDNTPSSIFGDYSPGGQRETLLNLLTSHIGYLNAPQPGQQPSQLVGRISNATQGSVSVAIAYSSENEDQYFNQTKYGAEYWQAILNSRLAGYVPGPQHQPILGQWYGGWNYNGGY